MLFRTGWTLSAACPEPADPMPRHWAVDLRSGPELASRPPAPHPRRVWRPIDVPGVAGRLAGRPSVDTYVAMYRDMIEHCGADLAAAVTAVARHLPEPTVVGCSLGKDRTGLVVALVLTAIGVPRRDVLAANEAALEAGACAATTTDYARGHGVSEAELRRRTALGTPALEEVLAGTAVPALLGGHGVTPGVVEALRRGLLA